MQISTEKYETLIDEIADLRSKQPKWISVNDRMPEDDGEVLAFDGEYVFIAHFIGDVWYDNSLYQQPVKVTHWMPLPEPPEVEDNETD